MPKANYKKELKGAKFFTVKVLLICTSSDSVCTFRIELIAALQKKGYEVSVVAFDDKRRADIEELGVNFYCVADKNRSLNPFGVISLKGRYYKIIKQVQPNVVFTFMLKPNTFGVFAAKKAGVNDIYSMVEGVGDVFINGGFKWKVIRKVICFLYIKAFASSKKVFFLNNDDKAEFIQRKLVKSEQCEVIPGIGVSVEKFAYKTIKNRKTFLMVARMLKTKGVYEYCKCARIVKQKHPDAVFNYLGAEGTVKVSDIREYIDDGSINYLGTTTDVRPYIENAVLLLLPSYREGMPMSIMEAEAVGRGVITSDVVGCRDTVVDGYNGFIVPRGDYVRMAEKAIWCINNPAEAEQIGLNARKFAEEKFDEKKINERIIKILISGGNER